MLNKIKKGVNKLNIFKSSNETNFSGNSMQNNATEINQYFTDPKVLIEELISEGKFESAVEVFKEASTVIENSHPLAPEYKYDIRKIGKKTYLASKPLNNSEAQKRPLSFRGKMTIIDERYNKEVDVQKFILQQSFRNNSIKVRLDSLEELIGGEVIENPMSLLKVVGDDLAVTIVPTQKRQIIKTKMTVKNSKEFINAIDYIELQITDYDPIDEVLVISNENQKKAYLELKMKIPLETMRAKGKMIEIPSLNFDAILNEEYCNTVNGELIFLEFLKSIKSSEVIQIVEVELGQLLFEATNQINNEVIADIEELDEQIKIFRVLKEVEEIYDVEFSLSDSLDEQEIEILNMLDAAYNFKEIKYPITSITALVDNKESVVNILEFIKTKRDGQIQIESTQTITTYLFGVELSFLNEEVFDLLTIKNDSRLKSKLDFFEEGETIKIPFSPPIGATASKTIKLISAVQCSETRYPSLKRT